MKIDNLLDSEIWFDYKNFYSEVAKKKYKVLVEIGTWKGHSIQFLAKKLKEENYNFELYGVDLYNDSQIHTLKGNEYLSNQIPLLWEIYNQNLINYGVREFVKDIKGISWEVATRFEDKSVDFVFIDADHEYESVKKDILAWMPKIKNGGIISGHDYHQKSAGVKMAVDEIFPEVKIGTDNIWFYEF